MGVTGYCGGGTSSSKTYAIALNHCGVSDVSVTRTALKGVLPVQKNVEAFDESTELTNTEPVECSPLCVARALSGPSISGRSLVSFLSLDVRGEAGCTDLYRISSCSIIMARSNCRHSSGSRDTKEDFEAAVDCVSAASSARCASWRFSASSRKTT